MCDKQDLINVHFKHHKSVLYQQLRYKDKLFWFIIFLQASHLVNIWTNYDFRLHVPVFIYIYIY